MTTYETTCFGDTYKLRANWAQSSSPVERGNEYDEWSATGYQVCDGGPEVSMRREIMDVVKAGGFAADESDLAEIDAAVSSL